MSEYADPERSNPDRSALGRPDTGCEAFDLDLGELAAGVIDIAEMPALATHLDGCLRCRLALDELTATVDRLSLLGPEIEPPPGFEARALASFRGAERRDDADPLARRRRAVVVVTVAATIALAIGLVAARTSRSSDVATAFDRVQVSQVRTARLVGVDGERVGSVIQLRGARTTYVMSLDRPIRGVTYRCEIAGLGSKPLVEWWTPQGSGHSWTLETTQAPSIVDGVRLVASGGATYATATLRD